MHDVVSDLAILSGNYTFGLPLYDTYQSKQKFTERICSSLRA
ncbi:hypothetical protein Bealeia1_02054 (plasmid) [Candidatus Bealeia paramacronuclearis]|uniref:Uncharacterized protein n=1 Tax=Candidatus Bealeia paramacronuclearis TaxID=1921001 RepID=A0ABZ2C8N1_9PROT